MQRDIGIDATGMRDRERSTPREVRRIGRDLVGAFAAGFVNPYASGYSTDTLMCWAILSAWIIYERQRFGVRHGWWCIVLGVVPGVAVGFALYLLLRMRQVGKTARDEEYA